MVDAEELEGCGVAALDEGAQPVTHDPPGPAASRDPAPGALEERRNRLRGNADTEDLQVLGHQAALLSSRGACRRTDDERQGVLRL
jgi:hypothetical protein